MTKNNLYELMVVVKPDLSGEDHKQIEAGLRQEVEKHKGEVRAWSIWAEKRRLAYPLYTRGAKKVMFSEATYILADISLAAQELSRLKYVLDLDERVFRFLLVRKKEK